MYLRVLLRLFAFIFLLTGLTLILCLVRERRRSSSIFQFFLKVLCRVIGLKVYFEGEHRGHDPRLIVANHLSYLDVLAIGSLFPTSFLAKREISHWPIAGLLANRCGTEFVTRDSPLDRVSALRRLRSKLKGKMNSFCIFPEGTTTPHTSPLSKNWHRGHAHLAAHSEVGLYCIGIHYQDQGDVAWIGDDAFVPHLLKVLCRPYTEVYLTGKFLKEGDDSSKSISSRSFKLVCELSEMSLASRYSRSQIRAFDQAQNKEQGLFLDSVQS